MKLGPEYLELGPSVEPAVIDINWGKVLCDDYLIGHSDGDTHIYVNKGGVVMDWVSDDSRWTLIYTSLF